MHLRVFGNFLNEFSQMLSNDAKNTNRSITTTRTIKTCETFEYENPEDGNNVVGTNECLERTRQSVAIAKGGEQNAKGGEQNANGGEQNATSQTDGETDGETDGDTKVESDKTSPPKKLSVQAN